MSKERIIYADFQRQRVQHGDAWSIAFARIQERQKVTDGHLYFHVIWKHFNPQWIQLQFRAGKEFQTRMVRQGDSFLLKLRPE